MPIPESQLVSWTGRGAVASSATAYNSIKAALSDQKSKVRSRLKDIFLQGSYKNATNIVGDSDVDIVVKLEATFSRDVSALDSNQKQLQQAAYAAATYGWPQFRSDVLESLQTYYGNDRVKPLNKCIQVITGPGRITADVVIAIDFKKYDFFYSRDFESHTEGISFFDSAGTAIANFPKQHIANGEAKNSQEQTNGWYKPTVRMFKNARNHLIDNGIIADNIAPSYCVECLIYNAPNDRFGTNFGDTYVNVVNYLWSTPNEAFISQNGIIPLCGNSPVQWPSDNASAFQAALRHLWLNWS